MFVLCKNDLRVSLSLSQYVAILTWKRTKVQVLSRKVPKSKLQMDFEVARVKPSPFEVVKCEKSLFKVWRNNLSSKNYKNKFSFPSRPIKQLRFTKAKALSVEHRDSYNGGYFTTNIRLNKVEIDIEKRRRLKKSFHILKIRRHQPSGIWLL